MAMMDEPSQPNRWHLQSAGMMEGVTFQCNYVNAFDSALETFREAMLPVMSAWPMGVTEMTITLH